jgi:uncharacterized protein DUF3574
VIGRGAFLVTLALVLAACASMPQRACKGGEQAVTHDSLYFGTATPHSVVTSAEWAEFLRATVTPRFPQGFTSWEGSGQWRAASGEILREGSHVVSIVHPDDEPRERAVLEIIAAYKSQFRQEAVLRLKTHACASF